eukprot:1107179-Alexandrium_andersonii.AAC.1
MPAPIKANVNAVRLTRANEELRIDGCNDHVTDLPSRISDEGRRAGATDIAPLMPPAGSDEPLLRRSSVARSRPRNVVRTGARPGRRNGVGPNTDEGLPSHDRPREGGMSRARLEDRPGGPKVSDAGLTVCSRRPN